jgi:GT2 family glycosyltransferase
MNTVSVYVPFKDSDESLREVLSGIAAQDHPITEVVLVDDGSRAPSSVFLPANIPTRIIRHSENLGVAAARNTALREVQGELVVSFDADIVPDKGCVSALVGAISREPGLSGVGGRVTERYTESVGDLFRSLFMKQDRGEEVLRNVDLFGGCTLYRRSALVEVGGYTEMLRNSFEDFDISRRVRERGGSTIYLPSARGEHIKRDTVISAVDTLYRWSYPHWESDERLAKHNWYVERIKYPELYYEHAIGSRIENLEYKIRADLTVALERIKNCTERRVLYPLILYPIRAVLRDLINYRACNGVGAVKITDLFGDLLCALFSNFISAALARRLSADSYDLLETLYGKECWDRKQTEVAIAPAELRGGLSQAVPHALPTLTFMELYSIMLNEYASRSN